MLKARKIVSLLGSNLKGLQLLDLGTGSGFLAEYFESVGAVVIAADRDQNSFAVNVPFREIDESALPFANDTFDVVVFNHVIEHVGDENEQDKIVAEIARVLKPQGKLYLAVPNKWALMEPHFRIPLLGAMPRNLADRLVRATARGERYDCYPLARKNLIALLAKHFGTVCNRSDDAAHWVMQNELAWPAAPLLKLVPLRILQLIYPTHVMICYGKPSPAS